MADCTILVFSWEVVHPRKKKKQSITRVNWSLLKHPKDATVVPGDAMTPKACLGRKGSFARQICNDLLESMCRNKMYCKYIYMYQIIYISEIYIYIENINIKIFTDMICIQNQCCIYTHRFVDNSSLG